MNARTAALLAMVATASAPVGGRELPSLSPHVPPRSKEPGTESCACGKPISRSAISCAACAGVTDTPTARRMARAVARQEHRAKVHQAICEIAAADPAAVEAAIAAIHANTTGEGLMLAISKPKNMSRRWRRRIAAIQAHCQDLLRRTTKLQDALCQDLRLEVAKGDT